MTATTDELDLVDFFAGAGGSCSGATAVPGVVAKLAANHWDRAIESHAANFPDADHFLGDLHDADVRRFPAAALFWASPECPTWSQARGQQRDYDRQPDLFGDTLADAATDRSRSLMWDVPRYLEACAARGKAVKAGVVENVTDVREWIWWRDWVGAIEKLGYKTRLIAMNSMHARPARTPFAPQSRDRLYLAYWLTSLGRDPDWDKWLRPTAWCPSCDQLVSAWQSFKQPGRDMGRYRQQWVYRCPHVACRGQIVEPDVQPAAVAIDWSDLGTRIGDRERPLSAKTLARIEAGIAKYAQPITLEAAGHTFERRPGVRTRPVSDPITTLCATETKGIACPPLVVPAGGTWRNDAVPVTEPIGTRTTRENDGLAIIPPLMVPVESRTSTAHAVWEPARTLTGRAETGVAVTPFLTVLRSGRPRNIGVDEPMATIVADGSGHALVAPPMIMRNLTARGNQGQMLTPVDEPIRTQTASGVQSLVVPPLIMRNNLGGAEMSTPVTEPARTLTTKGHQSLVVCPDLLVPYNGTGVARPVTDPAGTITAADRYALAAIDLDDVRFRMLTPGEIQRAMAFLPGYVVLGNKRERTRQLGNAVTPPVAEVIVSALVEAITGEPIT